MNSFAFFHFLSGFLLFLLGMWVGLPKTLLFAVPLLCYAAALYTARRGIAQFFERKAWRIPADWPRFPLAVILFFFALNLAFSLLPPGDHVEADGLIYHLAIPWQYYLRGGVTEISWSVNDKFPLYLQMAQLPFTVLTFPWIVKIWQIAAHAFLLAVVWNWAAKMRCSAAERLWILAFLSAMALFAKQYGTALFDLVNLVYILLGFFYLFEGVEEKKRGSIAWGSVFLGIACTAKTFYLYLALVWFLAFWCYRFLAKQKFSAWQMIWISASPLLSALFWMLPVYARNVSLTGNPFFPLFLEKLGPRIDNPVVYDVAKNGYMGIYGYGHSILDFILMPIRMVLPDGRFDYWTDPILLLFLAATLLGLRRLWREGHGLILLCAFFLYLFLFFGSQQARFLYPFWIWVVLLGGKWILERAGKKIAALALLCQSLLCAGLIFFFHRDTLAALKQGPLNEYLQHISFSYLWNRQVPPDAKTLCLRPLAKSSLKDFLYFTIPVTVVEHPNSVFSLSASKDKVACDTYMVGSQSTPESIFGVYGEGILVSREEFWNPQYRAPWQE